MGMEKRAQMLDAGRSWSASVVMGLLTLAMATPTAAQDYPRPEDVATPEALVAATYESVTRRPGQAFDWERLRSLNLPGSLLVPNVEQRGGEFGAMTTDEFIAWVDAWYEENAPIDGPDDRGFAEEEIHSIVRRYGDVAQVISTYQKRYYDSEEILGRGINFITLVFDGERWWVAATLWDEEDAAGKIPAQFLP